MAITLAEAQEVIDPKAMNAIIEWVSGGVEDYYKSYKPGVRKDHSDRSRASLIHDHIIARAVRGYTYIPGSLIKQRLNRYLLLYRDAVLGSFKKIDRRNRARGNRTVQSAAFVLQLPLLDLPAKLTNLIIGYRLNSLKTSWESIHIICPNGQSNYWAWQIASRHDNLVLLPSESVDAGDMTGKSRITPKKLPSVASEDPDHDPGA